MPERWPEHWHDPGPVKLHLGERCAECKSPDPRGMPPMFHPEHKWGPCIATDDGVPCPCTAHLDHTPAPPTR